MKRLLEYDPITKTRRIFRFNHAEDEFVISTEQDVADVIEDTKARYAAVDERAPWRGDWHRVASIPMSIYNELQAKGILDDQRALSRWLNDSDNRVFRTRPGRV